MPRKACQRSEAEGVRVGDERGDCSVTRWAEEADLGRAQLQTLEGEGTVVSCPAWQKLAGRPEGAPRPWGWGVGYPPGETRLRHGFPDEG